MVGNTNQQILQLYAEYLSNTNQKKVDSEGLFREFHFLLNYIGLQVLNVMATNQLSEKGVIEDEQAVKKSDHSELVEDS